MSGAAFERAVAAGRLEYWHGVRDAQLGRALSRHSMVGPSYRLGVYHVDQGVIPRATLAVVHGGPEFLADPDDAEPHPRPTGRIALAPVWRGV